MKVLLKHPSFSEPVESNPVKNPLKKVLKIKNPVKSNLILDHPGEKLKWLLNPVKIPHAG